MIVKLFGRSVLTMLGTLVLVFFLVRLIPGDPVLATLGSTATDEMLDEVRKRLGLDASLGIQFFNFITSILQGELGNSLIYHRSSMDLVWQALPATLMLGAAATMIAVMFSIPAGIVCAVYRDSLFDRILSGISLLTQTMPTFWVGIILIFIFSLKLRLLPTSGDGSLRHLILPAVTLATFQIALCFRTMRSSMLEVLQAEYIRTARAKGLHPFAVVMKHGFRNALVPMIIVLGVQIGAVISGAVVTEAVFSWPGLGTLAMDAILARDYNLILAAMIIMSAMVIFFNMAADIIVYFLDPDAKDKKEI